MSYTPSYMLNPNNYNLTPYQQSVAQQQMFGQQMFGQQIPMQPVQQVQQGQYNSILPKQDFTGAFINDFNEVKEYPVPLGGTVLLMEKGANKFYMKALDNSGNPVISTFKFDGITENTSNSLTDSNNKNVNMEDQLMKIYDSITKKFSELENKIRDLESKVVNVPNNQVAPKGGRS